MKSTGLYGRIPSHVLFLFVLHFVLIYIRHILPTTAGLGEYYPENDGSTVSEEIKVERKRYEKSLEFYQTFRENEHQFNDMLDIRIVASDRKSDYLMQVVGFLLNSFEGQATVPLVSICNTEDHVFEELEPFKSVLPIHDIGRSMETSSSLSLNERISKEASDYWQCLNVSTNARYILLLEDDALVLPEFSKFINITMHQLEMRPDIDYVKLFHPTSLRVMPSIPMAGCIALAAVATLQWILFRRFILLLLVLSTIVLFIDIRSYSSQFMSDLRYFMTDAVYFSMSESCCTLAVIFPSSSVAKMVNDLSSIRAFKGRAKDYILDESSFVGRETDFNLVAHIGSVSSIRTIPDDFLAGLVSFSSNGTVLQNDLKR